MSRTADVVIVGGGVIGLTIARALRQGGVRDVALIERGQLGAEASWAAGGILGPQIESDQADDFFRLACASRDRYRAFANALCAESGVEIELDMTGTLYLGFTPDDENELRRRFEWQTNAGLAVELLSAGDDSATLMPRVQGLSLRQALEVLAPLDVRVEVTGRGIVVSQAPPPGAPVPAGAMCSLALASPAARP